MFVTEAFALGEFTAETVIIYVTVQYSGYVTSEYIFNTVTDKTHEFSRFEVYSLTPACSFLQKALFRWL